MTSDTPPTDSKALDPNEILIAEFNYIAQTAFQNNEDRARVTSFYLVAVGTLVAAILSTDTIASSDTNFKYSFAALFIVLSVAGLFTLRQLITLRWAWLDSVTTMNHIKRFYNQHARFPELAKAFRWSDETLPPLYKRDSVSFLLAVQVMLLSSVTLGAAAVFLGLALYGHSLAAVWSVALIAGIAYFALQHHYYKTKLSQAPK